MRRDTMVKIFQLLIVGMLILTLIGTAIIPY